MQVVTSFVKTFSIVSNLLWSSPSPRIVTDIQGWNHPVKDVFAKKGIAVQKVVLVDKVKPIFYVSFPNTAATCDSSSLDQTLREISKANSHWPYSIVDSSAQSVSLKAEVLGDPKRHVVTAIRYSVKKKCHGKMLAIKRVSSSKGALEIMDRSREIDVYQYEMKLNGASASDWIDSGPFSLDGVKEIGPASVGLGDVVFLATFSGPGMNCHEKYRVIQMSTAGKSMHSDEFGFCSDVAEAKRSGDSVVIKTNSEMEGIRPATYVWKNGKLKERKER